MGEVYTLARFGLGRRPEQLTGVSVGAATPPRPTASAGLGQDVFQRSPLSQPSLSAVPLFGARNAKPGDAGEKRVRMEFWVSPAFKKNFEDAAARRDKDNGEYLEGLHPEFNDQHPEKTILEPITETVKGSHRGVSVETNVTALFGPDQLLQEWLDTIDSAKDYIQVSLFDFDNDAVGGRGADGSNAVAARDKQQLILEKLIEKARQGVRVQVILDNSIEAEYQNGVRVFSDKSKSKSNRNNQDMLDKLNELRETEGLPIEAIPYPSKLARIYHLKLLIADGKRAVAGSSMNLSNHSAANWDMGFRVEGPEVANIQQETFHEDYVMSKYFADPQKLRTPQQIMAEDLPQVTPVSDPAIRVLNTMPREYAAAGFQPREQVADFYREQLSDPNLSGLLLEQFIFTHIPAAQEIIRLVKENKLPVKIVHGTGPLSKFPYARRTIYRLNELRDVVRMYRERKATGENMHAKCTVFRKKDPQDSIVLSGSANTSAAGLETNITTGDRDDYPSNEPRKYRRGNREMSLAIPAPQIAKAIERQIEIDWEFSERSKPDAYGLHEDVAEAPLPSDVGKLLDEVG